MRAIKSCILLIAIVLLINPDCAFGHPLKSNAIFDNSPNAHPIGKNNLDSILLINDSDKEIQFVYTNKFDEKILVSIQPYSIMTICTDEQIFLVQTNKYQNFYIIYPKEKIHIKLDHLNNAKLNVENNPTRNNELDFSRKMNETVKLNFWTMLQYRGKYQAKDYLKLDSIYKEEYNDDLKFLDEYVGKTPMSSSYTDAVKAYFIAHLLGSQLFFMGIESKQKISPAYQHYLASLEKQILTNPLYNNDIWYNKLQYNFLKYTYRNVERSAYSDSMYQMAKERLTGYAKERVLFWVVKDALAQNPESDKWFINDFISSEQDTGYRNYIASILYYNKPAKNAIGTKVLLDKQSKEFSYDSVVSKLKGKIIYIDFWASWCAPCRAEMPAEKRLRYEYRNSPVEFVFFSIDKEINSWKTACRQENIDNLPHNYFIAGFENSSLNRRFKVASIPRYILINKDGKIIDANAPRPSDSKLKELIDKYLK